MNNIIIKNNFCKIKILRSILIMLKIMKMIDNDNDKIIRIIITIILKNNIRINKITYGYLT